MGSSALLPGLGVGTRVQAVPFQWTIRVRVKLPVSPTAHALRAGGRRNPRCRMAPAPGLGLGTRVQAVPFQCRIIDESGCRPAAKTLLAELAATLYRRPENVVYPAGLPALAPVPVLAALAAPARCRPGAAPQPSLRRTPHG